MKFGVHHLELWGPCKCVVLGTSCRHHGSLLPCTPCSRAHTVAVCGRSLGLVGQIIIPALGFISCVTSSHSWRTEAALADTVDWIGWRISVSTWTVAVPPGKLVRIVEQIKSIQKSRQLTLRDLQSLVGRLLWLTSAWHYLRPLLIPLCKALRRIPTTMVGMDHVTFHSLVQQLDDQLQLTASLTHKHQSLRPGITLVRIANSNVQTLDEVRSFVTHQIQTDLGGYPRPYITTSQTGWLVWSQLLVFLIHVLSSADPRPGDT